MIIHLMCLHDVLRLASTCRLFRRLVATPSTWHGTTKMTTLLLSDKTLLKGLAWALRVSTCFSTPVQSSHRCPPECWRRSHEDVQDVLPRKWRSRHFRQWTGGRRPLAIAGYPCTRLLCAQDTQVTQDSTRYVVVDTRVSAGRHNALLLPLVKAFGLVGLALQTLEVTDLSTAWYVDTASNDDTTTIGKLSEETTIASARALRRLCPNLTSFPNRSDFFSDAFVKTLLAQGE